VCFFSLITDDCGSALLCRSFVFFNDFTEFGFGFVYVFDASFFDRQAQLFYVS